MLYGNIKFKAALLLCLAAIFTVPAQAQVSSLTVSQSGGSITLSWNSFASTHYIKENGVTVSQTSGSTRTLNRPAGNYQYMVSSCYDYGDYSCIYSNTVNVTVVATPPPPPPPPAPLEFTVGSLQQFMALARGQDKSLANLIGDEIETRLRNANLSLDENGLTYSENLPTIQIRSGCTTNIQARRLHVNASLNNASRFELVMDSLSKPIIATAQLIGTVEAGGQVRVRLGFKVFGECIRYLKASVDGTVRTDFTINASLMIKLNPSRVVDAPANQLRIRINPQATLTGNMSVTNTSLVLTNANLSILGINVFSGVVGNLLEKQLLKFANGAISNTINGNLNNISIAVNSYFGQYLAEAQADINNKLAALPREYSIPVDTGLSNDMLSFLSYYALNYLPPAGFLQANSTDLLYLLLVGDDKAIRERVATSLACNASADLFTVSMSRAATPSPYRTTTRNDFCLNIDNRNWLGNAEPSVAGYTGQDSWTLMPSTSFNLSSIAPINGNYQPYMRRVHYRTIDGITDGTRTVIDYNAYGAAMSACYANGYYNCQNPPSINNYTTYVPIPRGTGSCKLEMRVYKKDVAQTGLKPLLALHGGAWKYRGAGFYGMESQLSHFTERGFVVFAPFYRLTGDSDGNIECNKATGEQVVADADAALTWVRNNMTSYGVTGGERVRLFGQSAGAHLSGWLVTHRPTEVQKALLMYPPTDAQDFLVNYQAFANNLPYSSEYANSFGGQGVESLEGYLSAIPGAPVNLLDVVSNSTLVLNNSFPGIVAGSPSYYPPVYMVHGKQDQLVPAIQSVRLCNAYSGNPGSGPATTAGTASRQAYACGPSRLDLLQEANHGLEICLPPIRCEAGASTAALTAAAQSLNDAKVWLAQ
jgi:acetyl esterase/lipase